MKDNSNYPVLRPCLQFINVGLCVLGGAGILFVLGSLEGIADLRAAHESGSSYLPYYLFLPAEIALAAGLVPGVMGCFTTFGRMCLIPSCVVGVLWSLLALYFPGRFLVLSLMGLDASLNSYLVMDIVLAILLAIPLLWTIMTIKFVLRVREEQRESTSLKEQQNNTTAQ